MRGVALMLLLACEGEAPPPEMRQAGPVDVEEPKMVATPNKNKVSDAVAGEWTASSNYSGRPQTQTLSIGVDGNWRALSTRSGQTWESAGTMETAETVIVLPNGEEPLAVSFCVTDTELAIDAAVRDGGGSELVGTWRWKRYTGASFLRHDETDTVLELRADGTLTSRLECAAPPCSLTGSDVPVEGTYVVTATGASITEAGVVSELRVVGNCMVNVTRNLWQNWFGTRTASPGEVR